MGENHNIFNLWAKISKKEPITWHPLILHLIDVAACAEAILMREPESTRQRIAEIFGLDWESTRPLVLLVIACHDLGKVCPSFQSKWVDAPSHGLAMPKRLNTDVHHGFVSQLVLSDLLKIQGWPSELSDLVADAIGCHHGERATESCKDLAEAEIHVGRGDRLQVVRQGWIEARASIFKALIDLFNLKNIPVKQTLSGPDFMLLSGLTSFSDWIGSNEVWFKYGEVEDCADLKLWFDQRRKLAEAAMDEIGWASRKSLLSEKKSFEQVFNFSPRSLQQSISDVLVELQKPSVLLIEAPMGEGKTEAALFAHLELQRRFGHRGLYIALPTKATGNAMFARVLKFLQSQGANRNLDFQLLHGATLLNDTFQNIRLAGVYDSNLGGEIRAGEWFTSKKRALLSEYGVGTIDQALLTILPVKHNSVRLWGLANRVVVFDEIHAYDTYTGTLLIHLLRWLLALGSSVILLSATLSPSIRRKLASAVNSELPEQEALYPRINVFSSENKIKQLHFKPDATRRLDIQIKKISENLADIRCEMELHLANGGMGLALVNTVQRAQDLYEHFPKGEVIIFEGCHVGKRLADGTEVFLFHARFPANQRQKREDQVLKLFGEKGNREGQKILIATQVAEQSLDLDFDLIATDLAPIDLILQRAGRLWRHFRKFRPVSEPILLIAGLLGNEPPIFGKPLWWGSVYREDVLLSTWYLLENRDQLILPDDIDALVNAVYEEQVQIPECSQDRFDKAIENGEGKSITHKGQANQAIIGFPEDSSWNDSSRFVLYDEDEIGVHRTLMAQTRLGEESVVVIPLLPEDGFNASSKLTFTLEKEWFLRALSLSRKGVVQSIKSKGVPEGWKKSPLLRNRYPLLLDNEGFWNENKSVYLDNNLGLIYKAKEEE